MPIEQFNPKYKNSLLAYIRGDGRDNLLHLLNTEDKTISPRYTDLQQQQIMHRISQMVAQNKPIPELQAILLLGFLSDKYYSLYQERGMNMKGQIKTFKNNAMLKASLEALILEVIDNHLTGEAYLLFTQALRQMLLTSETAVKNGLTEEVAESELNSIFTLLAMNSAEDSLLSAFEGCDLSPSKEGSSIDDSFSSFSNTQVSLSPVSNNSSLSPSSNGLIFNRELGLQTPEQHNKKTPL